MDNSGKEGSMWWIFIIMLLSLIIASLWQNVSWIKEPIHFVLDPTIGRLIEWNMTWGMLIVVLIFSIITTLAQKYGTDQEQIKELKKQQKEMNKQMRELRNEPEKMLEIQKEIAPLSLRLMKLSMRPVIYTGIPFILFFRWFMDIFTVMGNPKFFGFLSWFWFYLIFVIIFSSVIRKVFKVE